MTQQAELDVITEDVVEGKIEADEDPTVIEVDGYDFSALGPPTGQLALPAIKRMESGAPEPEPQDMEPRSLASSLKLHLMSEHGIAGALEMDDQAADELHIELHDDDSKQDDHGVDDHFFRPELALSRLRARTAYHEAVQRTIIPNQYSRT